MLGRYELKDTGSDSDTASSINRGLVVIAGVVAVGFFSEFIKHELKKKAYERQEKKKKKGKRKKYRKPKTIAYRPKGSKKKGRGVMSFFKRKK